MSVKLTADLIEGFSGTFLSPMFDEAKPTPAFHRECWEIYCGDKEFVAIAAPRGHAKSTALTHSFSLAVLLFRVQDYILIVSATEELAIAHLGDIATELRDNDDLIREFKIKRLAEDSKTSVVVEFTDGHQARLMAKGSGQKMRGLKWNGKRPGLIICDDLEEDEQVESKDRRDKFRRWFDRALLPCKRNGGMVRMHGTILHEDALLARLLKDNSWVTRKYSAHAAFDDFSNILWPEQFSEETLRALRQRMINSGDAPGYSQEYLNDPLDNSEAYLRRGDFIPMNEEDMEVSKVFKVGCDFAVSKADRANRTSFTVGGQDTRNLIHVVDQYKGRWDPTEWIDVMFVIEERYSPDEFLVEGGVIWNAIKDTLYAEMRERDLYLNIRVINPVKDKAARGKPYQKRHRAGAMRFNKQADWYPAYEDENLRFTGGGDREDDQFDSTAILVKGFETSAVVEEEDFRSEEDWELIQHDPREEFGRSAVTGY